MDVDVILNNENIRIKDNKNIKNAILKILIKLLVLLTD